ncbi:MAG: hypothetical protein JWM19_839 [Actinomycetia bacterium]|nr:hypothetical protein [Actinomycetes bacterium]
MTNQTTTASIAVPQFTSVGRGFHPGEVMTFINRLVQKIEELERRVAPAVERAAGNPAVQQSVLDLLKIAAGQIEGEKLAAHAEIEQSRQQAQAESEGLLAGSRQQASSIIENARADASRQLDKASAEAAAVTDGAAARMSAVRQVHAQTLQRLTAINEVTRNTLEAERQRGSLDDEVSRAMGIAPATAPQQLPAAPGASGG